jgi:AraC-like DNA-binding protein
VRSSTFASAADILRQSASLFEQYFPRPLAIAELARHCHVSTKTLSTVFVSIVGEAPSTTIKRWRLKKLAHSIVRKPEESLLWHGLETGIAFTRLDKRLFQEMYCQDVCSFRRSCDHVRPQAASLIPWDEHCDATREIELIIQASGCNQFGLIATSSGGPCDQANLPSKNLVMIR